MGAMHPKAPGPPRLRGGSTSAKSGYKRHRAGSNVWPLHACVHPMLRRVYTRKTLKALPTCKSNRMGDWTFK